MIMIFLCCAIHILYSPFEIKTLYVLLSLQDLEKHCFKRIHIFWVSPVHISYEVACGNVTVLSVKVKLGSNEKNSLDITQSAGCCSIWYNGESILTCCSISLKSQIPILYQLWSTETFTSWFSILCVCVLGVVI